MKTSGNGQNGGSGAAMAKGLEVSGSAGLRPLPSVKQSSGRSHFANPKATCHGPVIAGATMTIQLPFVFGGVEADFPRRKRRYARDLKAREPSTRPPPPLPNMTTRTPLRETENAQTVSLATDTAPSRPPAPTTLPPTPPHDRVSDSSVPHSKSYSLIPPTFTPISAAFELRNGSESKANTGIPGVAPTREETRAIQHNTGTLPTITSKTSASRVSSTLSASHTNPATLPTPDNPAPKSWADIFRRNGKPGSALPRAGVATKSGTDGKNIVVLGAMLAVADFLRGYTPVIPPPSSSTHEFRPRPLTNTGNTCYLNAALQALVSTSHFRHFFRLLSTTTYVNPSRAIAGDGGILLEALGAFVGAFYHGNNEAFAPDGVYEALRVVKMARNRKAGKRGVANGVIKSGGQSWGDVKGRQEDAEEFLNLLLDGVHEECVEVLKEDSKHSTLNGHFSDGISTNGDFDDFASNGTGGDGDGSEGWMEVGRKNRTSFTRKTEHADTPITKIFSGRLRSVVRAPGVKDSIVSEPFQALQLDVTADHVHTITDALRSLTHTEYISDFQSPSGAKVEATKKTTFEALPPVLMLHLKRFAFDKQRGDVDKVAKPVSYPPVLRFEPQMLSPASRTILQKAVYRLVAVVYHHGLFSGGGHYTADVLWRDANSTLNGPGFAGNPASRSLTGDAVPSSPTDTNGENEGTPLVFKQSPTRAGTVGRLKASGSSEGKKGDKNLSKWLHIDDDAMDVVSEARVLEAVKSGKETAYLLFYERVDL
ncbi:cysteine proteinase [Gonapodya prolifera JEL478]|uniref:ubiquitinyl hydrolase 1 n=1 Tax=Gonapodya prolifera (strain JEL478) TaxID=1344416 RepID=A0A139AEC1_GONPJ|nr:cysteine proteinase [Gonapodya prolifera JEL478]|eukprot:KXS15108.1 cysteine proteinase [Gonapodya prolifera JEL478]